MKVSAWLVAVGALVASTSVASAQVVSIGTTKGGAVAQIGTAVASVVSSKTDLQMRPQKVSGTQQYVDATDQGVMEFGIANTMQYYMGVTGTGLSKGREHKNLRLVATLVPFVQGIIVAKDSGINSVADLKGKRIPAAYGSSPLFQTFWEAFLANAGLSYKDVTPVPVASLPKSWGAFKEGQVDAVIAAAGSAAVREMNSVVSGGIKYLSIEDTESLREALPRTKIETVEPKNGFDGVLEPTAMHTYEAVLFANASVPDETVYKVVKALAEGADELRAAGPLLKGFKVEAMGMDQNMDFHPGAVKYFEEAGLSAN